MSVMLICLLPARGDCVFYTLVWRAKVNLGTENVESTCLSLAVRILICSLNSSSRWRAYEIVFNIVIGRVISPTITQQLFFPMWFLCQGSIVVWWRSSFKKGKWIEKNIITLYTFLSNIVCYTLIFLKCSFLQINNNNIT